MEKITFLLSDCDSKNRGALAVYACSQPPSPPFHCLYSQSHMYTLLAFKLSLLHANIYAYQHYVHYLHIKSSVLRKYYICQTQFNYRYSQDQYCDLFHLVCLYTYVLCTY